MPTTAEERVFTAVRRNVLIVIDDIDPAEVTIGRTLRDLGCNSVDRAEIVSMTMADLDVAVPVAEFAQVGDLRSLVAVLARHLL
jgi:polyketide biosynthesis acyl carrier protein